MEAAVRRHRPGPVPALVALAAGLCAVLVTGCSSNPAPTPLADAAPSTSSSRPSPTRSPSPDGPPTLPAVAHGSGTKAAKAFVRYYIETINYSAATGDVRPLRPIGTANCVSCHAIIRNITTIYAAGGSIESSGWRLNSMASVPQQPHRRPIFELAVFEAPQLVTRPVKPKAKRYDGGKQPMTIRLVHRQHRWLVTRLDLVS